MDALAGPVDFRLIVLLVKLVAIVELSHSFQVVIRCFLGL